jgi:hypothetical protein
MHGGWVRAIGAAVVRIAPWRNPNQPEKCDDAFLDHGRTCGVARPHARRSCRCATSRCWRRVSRWLCTTWPVERRAMERRTLERGLRVPWSGTVCRWSATRARCRRLVGRRSRRAATALLLQLLWKAALLRISICAATAAGLLLRLLIDGHHRAECQRLAFE